MQHERKSMQYPALWDKRVLAVWLRKLLEQERARKS